MSFSLIATSVLFTFSLLTSFAFAVDQRPVLEMPFTDYPPTIDGKWTTSDEWKYANHITITNGSSVAFLYASHDRDFIYLMLDFVGDQTNSLAKGPSGSVEEYGDDSYFCFDTNNNFNNQFETGDFCYYLTFGKTLGTSTIWRYAGAFTMSSSELNPSNVFGSAGFSSNNDPNENGRDHAIYEIKIPLNYLHKQDKFGFYSVAIDKDTGTAVRWPADYSRVILPNTWGKLISPDQSITAPPVPIISVSPQTLSFGNEEVSGKSGSQTVTISNIGTGLLKISNIQTQGEFSMSDTNTPIEIQPKQSTSLDITLAPITTGDKSGQITVYSNDLSNPVYTISMSGKGIEKGTTPFGGRCLIATAAFGSELSPQVQFLRGFRDNHILATESGSSFMNVFNAWYYSFSPYVADYERQQPWLQEIVRTSIYPLLGILTVSEKGFSTIQGDYGAVTAGAIASSMIGAVYFWPFALSIKQVRKNKFNYKIAIYVLSGVFASVVGSIIVGNQYALMITTSSFVLTLLSISAILVAKLITKTRRELLKNRKLE